jgi:hypothetical protein
MRISPHDIVSSLQGVRALLTHPMQSSLPIFAFCKLDLLPGLLPHSAPGCANRRSREVEEDGAVESTGVTPTRAKSSDNNNLLLKRKQAHSI